MPDDQHLFPTAWASKLLAVIAEKSTTLATFPVFITRTGSLAG